MSRYWGIYREFSHRICRGNLLSFCKNDNQVVFEAFLKEFHPLAYDGLPEVGGYPDNLANLHFRTRYVAELTLTTSIEAYRVIGI